MLEIAVSSIKPNPFQPRKELGEQEIMELSESIKEFGVLQPILVKHKDDGYELIAGERRLRAAAKAGLANIPAIVVEIEPLNQQIIALVENIQRKNLSSIEEAVSLQDILAKTGWKQTELSRRMGRSQASIANKLRLLRLEPAVQEMVLQGKLGERQARALLSLPAEEQKMLAQKAIDEDLSTKAIESLAENWNSKPPTPRPKGSRSSGEGPGGELLGDIAELVNRHRARGTMAQWKVKQMNQSSLVVEISVDLMKTDLNEDENVG
jgi:ParB family chromosome partitioning protein